MADKNTTSKPTAGKPTAPAAKPATTARTTPAAKPATTARTTPAAKPATTARTTPAAKPATTDTAKPTAQPAARKAVLTETVSNGSAAVKPSASEKPADKKAAGENTADKNAKAQGGKSKAAAYVAENGGKVKQKKNSPRAVIAEAKRKKAEGNGDGNAPVGARELELNTKLIITMAVTVLFVILFIVIIALAAVSCSHREYLSHIYKNPYPTTTRAGVHSEYLGEVPRSVPKETQDGGLPSGYPAYGKSLGNVLGGDEAKVNARNAIIHESNMLCATGTANAGSGGGYNIIKANGALYNGDEPALDENGNPRKLYKHSAAVGMYGGDVADDEPGIVKRVTFKPRQYTSYYDVTGVYAPAGEVVKVEISEEDMNATGGIVVHIGQALYNGQANNIWAGKNAMNRMPVILNTLALNKNTMTLNNGVYTGYVGSFLGGPIYVRDERVTFSVTISGGVRYSHFILGYTTPEEFAENAKSSAPMFDLEVWDNGVLHSGPVVYAKKFTYDELYKAAVLWDKIALVSTQVTTQGIVFLYDPFVAAGAAVAFPGRRSVNCPMGWMSSSLNCDAFVNGGSWGNMHEYNHNFQSGWGRGSGGEVTNNALNLVSYSLFTRISGSRGIGDYGASGLSGWNRYTSPSWATSQAIRYDGVGRANDLSVYAAVLHSFGQKKFIDSIHTQRNNKYGMSPDGWCKGVSDAVGYNMSYYFKDLVGYGISSAAETAIAEKNYPMFVPISSVFQTGRVISSGDGEYKITTAQPYKIKYGEPFDIDLRKYAAEGGMYESGSLIYPEGFTIEIKNITQPANGRIEVKDAANGIFTYTPSSELRSGEIVVTLGITKNDGAFSVGDAKLIIELEQTHEFDEFILERTSYAYSADKMYSTATAAYDAGYAGYSEKLDGDNINPTQNCNTDIWVPTPSENAVLEVRGKLYVAADGKYRIALRGRHDAALYLSFDGGKNYELAVDMKNPSNDYNFLEGNYRDYDNLKTGQWIYYKSVLLVTKANCFIGVGWGKFEPPNGVIDEDGNLVGGGEETISVDFATAYRANYEFPSAEFVTDYFYTREYSYGYAYKNIANKNQTILSAKYTPYNANRDKLENLVDGNKDGTYIHTRGSVSITNPFEVVIDMGERGSANSMVITSQQRSDLKVAQSFTLYGSDDGENFFVVGDFVDAPNNGRVVSVQFDTASFRYYKLVVTKSMGGFLIITDIELAEVYNVPNGKLHAPDSNIFRYAGEWTTESGLSEFGHKFVGRHDSEQYFSFTGNRFALFVSGDYEVEVDGEIVTSSRNDGGTLPQFLSPVLDNGTHYVTLRCNSDGVRFEAAVTWSAAE